MREIICDELEIKKFHADILPQLEDNEVHFVSLSARNKQLDVEERKKYSLGRTEMFERKLIRNNDWERFIRTIRKFQTDEMAYTTKTNLSIPDKCVICYINVNPTDAIQATINFIQESMNNIMLGYKGGSDSDFWVRADLKLMKHMQNTRSRKCWIDIDFDLPHEFDVPLTYFVNECIIHHITYCIIETKGGWHVMISRASLKNAKWNYTDGLKMANTLAESVKSKWEIVTNKSEMVPLPGTWQAGFPVRIVEYKYFEGDKQ